MTVRRSSRRPPPPAAATPSARAPSKPQPKPASRPQTDGFDGTATAPRRVDVRPPELPRPLRVVVTGYGDFMGVYDEAGGRPNPSSVLARKLSEMGLTHATIEYRHLDVTHAAVERFLADVKANPPDIILSMGVAPHAQVEERPENWKGDGVDGAGQAISEGVIDPSRPAHQRIPTDLPVDAIEDALSFGVRAGVIKQRTVGTDDKARSGPDEDYFPDDSAYLCNYLNYRLTESFGQDDAVTAGFVHVTERTTPEEVRTLLQAVVNREQDKRAAPKPVS